MYVSKKMGENKAATDQSSVKDLCMSFRQTFQCFLCFICYLYLLYLLFVFIFYVFVCIFCICGSLSLFLSSLIYGFHLLCLCQLFLRVGSIF